MNNIRRTEILISSLKPGMTVEYEGTFSTVCKKDIKKGFLGYSFRGDASKRKITRIEFIVHTNNGIVFR